jgi:hypothetical protein
MRGLRLFVPMLVLSLTSPLWGHEVRPGYLELREVSTETYEVLWKKPARGEVELRLSPTFPSDCRLGSGN